MDSIFNKKKLLNLLFVVENYPNFDSDHLYFIHFSFLYSSFNVEDDLV